MEQLYVFGTGHAAVTRIYNTCFAIRDGERFFMVDAGGGNPILRVLKDMNIKYSQIHDIFVTHEHTDHLLGVIWMIRFIASGMKAGTYDGDLNIYCHEELCRSVELISRCTLGEKLCSYFGTQIHMIPVHDGETISIMDYDVTFFDIHSTKARQFGFTVTLKNGRKLTCCGDEPFHPSCTVYAENSDWLLHEAFCLYEERDIFKPYEKHHSTAKDACELAAQLNVSNLVLWHTEDKNIAHRKELYTAEGRPYYQGNIFVPDDMEILNL